MIIEPRGRERVVIQEIRSTRGKRRAVAFRKKFGPALKPLPALVRKSGKQKARRILDFLTGAGFRGRAARMGKTFLHYGYTPGSRWIEKLQFGGMYRRGIVPPREIVGMNQRDIKHIENIYADGYLKRAMKG